MQTRAQNPPTTRHALYWTAATALWPLLYFIVNISTYHNSLAQEDYRPPSEAVVTFLFPLASAIATVLMPLLQWQALRPFAPGLRWWQWPPAVWCFAFLQLLAVIFLGPPAQTDFSSLARDLSGWLVYLGGDGSAALVEPDWYMVRHYLLALLPYVFFHIMLPADYLATKSPLRRRDFIFAGFAGLATLLLVQLTMTASGACHQHPNYLLQQGNALTIATALCLRCSQGALYGSVAGLVMAWRARKYFPRMKLVGPICLAVGMAVLLAALALLVNAAACRFGSGYLIC